MFSIILSFIISLSIWSFTFIWYYYIIYIWVNLSNLNILLSSTIIRISSSLLLLTLLYIRLYYAKALQGFTYISSLTQQLTFLLFLFQLFLFKFAVCWALCSAFELFLFNGIFDLIWLLPVTDQIQEQIASSSFQYNRALIAQYWLIFNR